MCARAGGGSLTTLTCSYEVTECELAARVGILPTGRRTMASMESGLPSSTHCSTAQTLIQECWSVAEWPTETSPSAL